MGGSGRGFDMSGWKDPRFIITLLLIGLFGYAYVQDGTDQAMKGAIIAAFSTAYGFWLASKDKEKATENTGKAFDAILAAQEAPAVPSAPHKVAEAAQATADAAQDQADAIAEDETGRERPMV